MSRTRASIQKQSTKIYLVLRLLQVAALLAYLLGSMLLSGGQIVASRGPMWGAVLDYPLFTFPGWASLVVAIVGVILVVPVLACARVPDASRVGAAFRLTAAAAGASFMFAWMLPSASSGELTFRWLAFGIDAAVTVVVMIVSFALAIRSDRDRARRGLPLSTGMDKEIGG